MKWLAVIILLAGIVFLLRGFLRSSDKECSDVNRHGDDNNRNIPD